MLPVEATSLIGSLGGIAEIAKASFGEEAVRRAGRTRAERRWRRLVVIADFVEGLGPWAWWIGGVILLALEIVLPGNVFVWFGIAAILTGVVAMFTDVAWQIQLIIFGVLSLVLVIVGRGYFARGSQSAEPLLNRRADSLVGRVYVLSEPIVGGSGTHPGRRRELAGQRARPAVGDAGQGGWP